MNEQLTATISGRVQGVFFRATIKKRAQELGLVGYAENMPDGRVRVVAQGERAELEELRRHCYNGVSAAEVNDVQVEWSEPEQQYSDFTIR